MFGSRCISISTASVILLLMSFSLLVNYVCHKAFACQCVRHSPEMYYERSDVIFVGKVSGRESAAPLEEGTHVTFHVLKSWKGVDTKTVTIHNGDRSSCGSYPFRGDDPEREYLVFATKDFFEIRTTLCGGTIPMDRLDVDLDLNPFLNIDLYLKYLDDNAMPIELKAGHTESVNIIPPLQILGGFVVVAVAAFILIKRS